jgi:hypothetical protein
VQSPTTGTRRIRSWKDRDHSKSLLMVRYTKVSLTRKSWLVAVDDPFTRDPRVLRKLQMIIDQLKLAGLLR